MQTLPPPRIPREEFFVPHSDARRQLGALIDLVLSVAILISGGALAYFVPTLQPVFPLVVGGMLLLDVAIYVVPVSRWGWSIGGLLTSRRVIDRATGGPLSMRRSAERYLARRTAGLRLRGDVRAELFLGAERPEANDRTMSMADRAVRSAVVAARLWGSATIRP
jgi:RDD family